MCVTAFGALAQFDPTGCSSIASGVSTSQANNNSDMTYYFDKRYLACDDVDNNAYNGFTFKAQFSVPNRTGIKNIFSVRVGTTNTIMVFRFNEKKVEVQRDVLYRPCTSWSNGTCQTFGSTVKGNMTFSSWDDDFVESNTGWIYVKLVDNGMEIKVSNSENGPYKTEFNYEGLHLSGVDQELADTGSSSAGIYIYDSSSSNVTLTNISFNAGHFTPVAAILIDNGSKSPETNFPASGGSASNPNTLAEFEKPISTNAMFKIHPNPAQDQVTLTLPERKSEMGIYFYRENGRVAGYYEVDDISLREATISTATYSRGFYLVRVVVDGKVYQKKLIVK